MITFDPLAALLIGVGVTTIAFKRQYAHYYVRLQQAVWGVKAKTLESRRVEVMNVIIGLVFIALGVGSVFVH